MTANAQGQCSFIDSNIWIYAATQSEDNPPDPRHETARQLISQVQPCLSIQVINEVAVNLIRKFKVSEAEVRELIRSYFQRYVVFPLNATTLTQASILREEYRLSFWDSLIIASALQQDCNTIYSEDMQNRLVIQERLTIINPFTNGF